MTRIGFTGAAKGDTEGALGTETQRTRRRIREKGRRLEAGESGNVQSNRNKLTWREYCWYVTLSLFRD